MYSDNVSLEKSGSNQSLTFGMCPILIIRMVKDVKGRGGSGYVVKKDSAIFKEWFHSN